MRVFASMCVCMYGCGQVQIGAQNPAPFPAASECSVVMHREILLTLKPFLFSLFPPSLNHPQQNNVLPSGEPNKTGTVFEVPHANRHTSGHYKCTADNRVGQPDSREIVVNVLCKYISVARLPYI